MSFVIESSFTMFEKINYYFVKYLGNENEKRVNNWYPLSSPTTVFLTTFFYLLFAKKIGPMLMENRKPFKLQRTIIVYNAVLVIVSLYLFLELGNSGWWAGYSWLGTSIDYSTRPEVMRMVYAGYWYYVSKYVELLDTVFFILRKKFNQLSPLHIIHHTLVLLATHWTARYFPCGSSAFVPFVNTFIHTIMYMYYFLAAFGPKYQKYLWWKKYLTVLQLIQFTIIVIHSICLLFKDTNVPVQFPIVCILSGFLMIYLFGNFYIKSYTKKTQKD